MLGLTLKKNKHKARIIGQDRRQLAKSLPFPNTTTGAECLLDYITENNNDKDVVLIGMGATGHYWLLLSCFLFDAWLQVNAINPIQSDAIYNLFLRKTKNGARDSILIAETICIGRFSKTGLTDEDILSHEDSHSMPHRQ